jgi:glycosyltransferase involved in cell wall biosynthesis
VASPQEALKQMDVLWLPSCVEGFGLVLIEAMASGVPVVACAAGGVLDVVTDRKNGLLVPPDANIHRAFAASLRTLRDDPSLRRKLIENGLQTVREQYTWQAVLPRYREIFALPN